MRLHGLCLALLGLSIASAPARAGFGFTTASRATQSIASPLYQDLGGSIDLDAKGTQHFTIDLVAGTAGVTSDLKGTDFLTPLGYASYDLYNTTTTGTVTDDGGGLYTVEFRLLFELKITSGPFAGTIFETQDFATFKASGIAGFPFAPGTAISDPNRPADPVTIFVQANPSGAFPPPGSPVGASYNRVVTVLGVVPEPSALVSGAIGAGIVGAFGLRRRMRRPA